MNEQLDRVLARHASLLSHGPATTANNSLELPEQPTPTLNNNNHMGDATWVPNHNNYVGKGTWASNHTNHTRQPTSPPNHINRTNREETDEEEEAAQLSHRCVPILRSSILSGL